MTEQNENAPAQETPADAPKVDLLGEQQLDSLVDVGGTTLPLREVIDQAAAARDVESREELLRRAQPALQMGAAIQDRLAQGDVTGAMELVAKQAGVDAKAIVPNQDPAPAIDPNLDTDDPTVKMLMAERQRRVELEKETKRNDQRLAAIEQSRNESALREAMERHLDRFELFKQKTPDAEFRRQNATDVVLASLSSVENITDADIGRAVEAFHTRNVRALEATEQARADSLRRASQVPTGIDPSQGLPELSAEELPTMDDLKKGGGSNFKKKALAAMNKLQASRTRLGT